MLPFFFPQTIVAYFLIQRALLGMDTFPSLFSPVFAAVSGRQSSGRPLAVLNSWAPQQGFPFFPPIPLTNSFGPLVFPFFKPFRNFPPTPQLLPFRLLSLLILPFLYWLLFFFSFAAFIGFWVTFFLYSPPLI